MRWRSLGSCLGCSSARGRQRDGVLGAGGANGPTEDVHPGTTQSGWQMLGVLEQQQRPAVL